MGKGKCKFTDELKSKYSCLQNGCDEWEAECLVCKPGTYVSVAKKGALDLRTHVESEKQKKAVRGEMSSANVFTKLGSKSDDAVFEAEDPFAFHTVKYHSSYKTTDYTSVLCSATTY
jgi:hypothetical protein